MRRALLPVVAPIAACALALGFGGPKPEKARPRLAQAPVVVEPALASASERAAIELWTTTLWTNAFREHQIRLWYEAAAEAERQAEAARRAAATRSRTAPARGGGGGGCTPEGIIAAESGGNITAQNPTSTASGKYQFLDSTWAGYGGYARAKDAPESVQDEKFEQTWAGGAGASHWAASVC